MTRGYRCRTCTSDGTIRHETQMFLDVFLDPLDGAEGGDAGGERATGQDER